MRYAVVENGAVMNIIELNQSNASDFPAAIPTGEDRPVAIGDAYADGVFTRDGEPVLTHTEQLEADLAAIEEALNE